MPLSPDVLVRPPAANPNTAPAAPNSPNTPPTPGQPLHEFRVNSSIGPFVKEKSPGRGNLRESVSTETKTDPEVRALFAARLYGEISDLAALNRPDPKGGNVLDKVLKSGALGIDSDMMDRLSTKVPDGKGGFSEIKPDMKKMNEMLATTDGMRIVQEYFNMKDELMQAAMGLLYYTEPGNNRNPNDLRPHSIPLADKGKLAMWFEDTVIPYLTENTSKVAGRPTGRAGQRWYGTRGAKIAGGAAGASALVGIGAFIGAPLGPLGMAGGGAVGAGISVGVKEFLRATRRGMQLDVQASKTSLEFVQKNAARKLYMKEAMGIDADDFQISADGTRVERNPTRARTAGTTMDMDTLREKLAGNMFVKYTYMNKELGIPYKNLTMDNMRALTTSDALSDNTSSMRMEGDVRRWFNANEGGIMSFCTDPSGNQAIDIRTGKPVLQPRYTKNVYKRLPGGGIEWDRATGAPALEIDNATGQPVVLAEAVPNELFDENQLDRAGNIERYFDALKAVAKQDMQKYLAKEMYNSRNILEESSKLANERAGVFAKDGVLHKQKEAELTAEKAKVEAQKSVIDTEITPLSDYDRAMDSLAADEKTLRALLTPILDSTGSPYTNVDDAIKAIDLVLSQINVPGTTTTTEINIDGVSITSIRAKDKAIQDWAIDQYDPAKSSYNIKQATGENNKVFEQRYAKVKEAIEAEIQTRKTPIDAERQVLRDKKAELIRIRDSVAQKKAQVELTQPVITKAGEIVNAMTKATADLTAMGIAPIAGETAEALLIRVNAAGGWPADENGNPERIATVTNYILEQRAQSLLSRTPSPDFIALMSGGFGISEGDLLTKSVNEILSDMRANNPTAPRWRTDRVERAIASAKTRVKGRVLTMRNYSDELGREVASQNDKILTLDLSAKGEQYQRIAEVMKAKRKDAIEQDLSEVAMNPDLDPRGGLVSSAEHNGLQYFAQDGVLAPPYGYEPGVTYMAAEQDITRLYPPGYIRTMRLIFQYHKETDPIKSENMFKSAVEVLPPDVFAQRLAEFLELRPGPTGITLNQALTELSNQITNGNIGQREFSQFVTSSLIMGYMRNKLVSPVTV